jgi:methanogenic corrinoid protein MtbC1
LIDYTCRPVGPREGGRMDQKMITMTLPGDSHATGIRTITTLLQNDKESVYANMYMETGTQRLGHRS